MKHNDEYYMSLALQEAKKAFDKNEIPVGCVIVLNDEIIALAHNTRQENFDVSGHAEINALKEASKKIKSWQLNKCVLYVTLEPCPMCASAIQQSKIERIVFGADDKKNGACGGLFDLFLIPKQNHYPFITSNVLKDECEQILKEYFLKKREK